MHMIFEKLSFNTHWNWSLT